LRRDGARQFGRQTCRAGRCSPAAAAGQDPAVRGCAVTQLWIRFSSREAQRLEPDVDDARRARDLFGTLRFDMDGHFAIIAATTGLSKDTATALDWKIDGSRPAEPAANTASSVMCGRQGAGASGSAGGPTRHRRGALAPQCATIPHDVFAASMRLRDLGSSGRKPSIPRSPCERGCDGAAARIEWSEAGVVRAGGQRSPHRDRPALQAVRIQRGASRPGSRKRAMPGPITCGGAQGRPWSHGPIAHTEDTG